jgi:hypothetical protein
MAIAGVKPCVGSWGNLLPTSRSMAQAEVVPACGRLRVALAVLLNGQG